MKREVLLVIWFAALSVAYCAENTRTGAVVPEMVADKCRGFARSMPSVLNGLSNVMVSTNSGTVFVNVTNNVEHREYHYPLSDMAHPKMVRVRGRGGNGYDICFDGHGNPTKYIESRRGQLHGLWLEFYTNGGIRVSMTLTNDCLVGQQLLYDEEGKLMSMGSLKGSILEIPVLGPKDRHQSH